MSEIKEKETEDKAYDSSQYIILPKDTVLHFEGVPCFLLQETVVFSPTIKSMGIEKIRAIRSSGIHKNPDAEKENCNVNV